jgi:F0F1-type ATP synthase membrane subunit b/b'
VDRAFSRRESSSILDLERAAFEAMRGNRTPAEIRLAQKLSFYDERKNAIHVEQGDRLTLVAAAKLGHAIIEDQKLPPDRRAFRDPIRVYKETHLAGVDWPHLMTIYNATGFFLFLALFLWRPMTHYLGTQGKKTAVALRNARDAREAAAEYRERYRGLAGEIEEKTAELTADTASRLEKEREEALAQARRQAEEIAGNVRGALRNEERRLAGDIGAETVRAACDQAGDILRARLGQAEHDLAIEELIADIASSMRPTARTQG